MALKPPTPACPRDRSSRDRAARNRLKTHVAVADFAGRNHRRGLATVIASRDRFDFGPEAKQLAGRSFDAGRNDPLIARLAIAANGKMDFVENLVQLLAMFDQWFGEGSAVADFVSFDEHRKPGIVGRGDRRVRCAAGGVAAGGIDCVVAAAPGAVFSVNADGGPRLPWIPSRPA